MDAARSQRMGLIGFCLLTLVLYTYGIISAPYIPSHIEGIALPLDFMVGIPVGYYLLVVRPRRLTPITVIPVIWVGYGLSVFALGSPDAGVLSYLLAALVPVEIAIAVRECLKVAKVYKSAKKASADPIVWFKETMLYLVRKDARPCARVPCGDHRRTHPHISVERGRCLCCHGAFGLRGNLAHG